MDRLRKNGVKRGRNGRWREKQDDKEEKERRTVMKERN